MDPKTVLLIVGANILALAVGLQRLDTQGIISLDKVLPYQFLGQPCGHGQDAFYAVVSERIVLPAGVSSGAGMSIIAVHLHGLHPSTSLASTNCRLYAVLVEDGSIVKVLQLPAGMDHADRLHTLKHAATNLHRKLETIYDYGRAVISTGLVDLHVHMDEPGREHWEGSFQYHDYPCKHCKLYMVEVT